jgi:hypothetical protein
MSYYIGATGEYIFDDKIADITSNISIANIINLDAGPLSDALQDIITESLGTALGEIIAPVTEVPSATGVGVVALTALGLLSYYKLDRTAVQDVDSMVYSSVSSSILTPGMFEDRIRIRYDSNQFSNAFYNVDNVKKGEILTSRINLLPAGVNDIDLYTNAGKIGIGTTPETQLHIYKGGDAATNIIRLQTPAGGSSSIEFKRGTEYDIYTDYRLIGSTGIFRLQYEDNELAYGDLGTDIIYATKTQVSIRKPTDFIDNVGIGTSPSTQLHIYNEVSPTIRIQSIAEGTPIVEFMRGNGSDSNNDYRFISESNTFKLQVQDATTYYMNANNQLISINATDTIIHKQTEFKANVLIGGDTKTIGYVGIGTTASVPLHVYTAAANILRLQTAPVNGTNSIEFVRGNTTDPLTDYRIFTNLDGKFKIQYANNLLAYGDAETDLIELSTTNTIIHKPTEFKGNIGIGTTPHATYKVDVNGTINATAFRGSASEITDIPADKITTGTLNNDRLTLTGTKLMEACDTNTFISNPSNKLDLIPVFTFNIMAYDRLAQTTATYLEAGKFSCTYEDRNGTYTMIPSYIPNVNNKVILNYRVGDKIVFKNTAVYTFDYQEVPAVRWARLSVFKMPSNINWTSQGQEISFMTPVIDWDSDSPNVLDWTGVSVAVRPRQTPITMQIQAGFKYFLVKWQRNNDANLYNSYITPATEASGMNIAYGGGQGFKISGDYSGTGGYKPLAGSSPPFMTADTAGTARRGQRLSIDEQTGTLSADIPTSADLITSMNTSHFTNNTGTNKIDISSTYVAPSATKLATARNIAGTAFDGSENINITYGNLTSIPSTWGESQIPSLPISKITNLQAGLDGKASTTHTHSIADITNLQTTLDGKAPTSHTHSIANITNLQTTLDGKASTTHTHAIADITNLQTTLDGKQATLTSTNLIGIFNTTQFEDVATKIQIKSSVIPAAQVQTDWNATTGMGVLLNKPAILTTTDINNTSNYVLRLDGHTSNYVARINTALGVRVDNTSNYVARVNTELLTSMGTLQPSINSTAGQLIIGNGNGFTTTSTGLTWAGGTTNKLTATNIATTSGLYPNFIDCTTTIRGEELRVFGYGLVVVGNSSTLMRISNNTNNELRVQQTLVAANDVKFSIFQRDNNVEYATPNITFYKGVIGIGTTTPATYPLTVGGDINITGNYRVNGALLDYFTLNNKPIILQPTTTNLQLTSGYTFSVPSNLAVGTTSIATNILQVGAGGRLRISNGTTDYTLLGTLDTDGSTNTSIVISGTTRSTNAGNIQYLATASGGSHIFYTASATTRMTISSSGVNVNNDLGVSGNVGVGVAPATYKLNVAGDINCTGAFRINGTALSTGSRWSLTPSTTNIFYNSGNVGIGTTNASQRLHITHPSNSLVRIETDTNAVSQISGIEFGIPAFASSTRSKITSTTGGSDSSDLAFHTSTGTGGSTERMSITSNGNVGIGIAPAYKCHIKCGYNNVATGLHLDASDPTQYTLTIWPYVQGGGQVGWKFRTISYDGGTNTPLQFYHNGVSGFNNFLYINNDNLDNGSAKLLVSGSDGSGISAYFYHPNRSQGIGIAYDGLRALGNNTNQNITMYPRGGSGQFQVYCNNNHRFNVNDGGVSVYTDLYVNNQIYGGFYAVSNTNTDYLCVQQNYGSVGSFANNWIKVAYGSFTAFHRCYADDELYNNESDESIDLFKNNYMGRVVIATGKIKSDFTRKKEVEPEPEPEPEIDSITGLPIEPIKLPKKEEDEWYSGIDKDGISIEDAVPVVALSRKKKDKRVFGVLGDPKRNTNNPNRLIVNSIGEGAICVANTNGNIENGDYLQSSDLLGYAERQDDDLLHNYTIAKSTIDCDFQLDSPYYQCKEIENGVRVAFIACSYHCG